jgi:hypothetical protein
MKRWTLWWVLKIIARFIAAAGLAIRPSLRSSLVLLKSLGCGGESGLVAGLDFKSSGIHRKVGSVGSIPMHLRHNNLQ